MDEIPELTIISGGQTGVDRAGLDIAIHYDIRYGGWCPKGGLAEDLPEPPGLLKQYSGLQETPSSDYLQRTAWNVRDSDATVIIAPNWVLARSGGTGYTVECAANHHKPCLIICTTQKNNCDHLRQWLKNINSRLALILNIAGPRASKAPGIYKEAYELLQRMISQST